MPSPKYPSGLRKEEENNEGRPIGGLKPCALQTIASQMQKKLQE
jgi:hypothetical protein